MRAITVNPILIPDGEEIQDLDRGLEGCYGYVSEVRDEEGQAALLVFVPDYSLADFRESVAAADVVRKKGKK